MMEPDHYHRRLAVGSIVEFKIHNNIACSSSTHPRAQVVLTRLQVHPDDFEAEPGGTTPLKPPSLQKR
jgi:hypothetical protein